MRVLFRLLLSALLITPILGCPGEVGSLNKNQPEDSSIPVQEHAEDAEEVDVDALPEGVTPEEAAALEKAANKY